MTQEKTGQSPPTGEGNSATRRVLMVAYDFPPRGGSGVQRTIKFIKYLDRLGWQSTVIAPDWDSGTRDKTLAMDLPSSLEVVRLGDGDRQPSTLSQLGMKLPGAWRVRRLYRKQLRFPDVASYWISDAVKGGRRLLGDQGFDVLYSTSPPVTAHAIALKLKRKTGIPWVADFRDPWTDSMHYGGDLSTWRRGLDLRLERNVCKTADVVIANTERNREKLLAKYDLPEERVVTIRNGYDEHDFSESALPRSTDTFDVCYCGAAYENYTPEFWVLAAERLLARRPDAKIRMVMAGGACDWAKDHNVSQRLENHVELRGYVAHADAVSLMRSAHLLVLSLPAGADYWVPGKLYEYLRAGTPIAASCEQPSEVSDILQQTGRGGSFGYREVDAASRFLETEHDRWQSGEWTDGGTGDDRNIAHFERSAQASQLAQVLDSLT